MNIMLRFLRPAVIIGVLPNTITNGQTADATPVMADFNWILSQVNSNAAELALTPQLAAQNTFTQRQSGVSAGSPANFPIASQVQNLSLNTLTSVMGTNTIAARIADLPLLAYANGQIFSFLPTQVNSGPVTMSIDGLAAAQILSLGSSLTGRELSTVVPLTMRYQAPYFHADSPLKVGGAFFADHQTPQTAQTGAGGFCVVGFPAPVINTTRGILTSTGFTPGITGLHQISANVQLTNMNSGAFYRSSITLQASTGGNIYTKNQMLSPSADPAGKVDLEFSQFLNLVAGTKYTVRVSVTGGGTDAVDINASSGPNFVTFWSGRQIGF